ncbi:MAG: methylmalonyl-CoA mutase family protein [Prolixibacteraceae bacterium]|jgi:methylmalonyl-CoA mutase|nr:methylmalonyl-CoA mutase family protein [Prolixibacteraceae bacterium]
MAENKIKLFEEFPPVTTREWEAKIEADLKGKDYDKALVWRTIEGFNVRPYYRSEDLEKVKYLDNVPGEFPYSRGVKTKGNDWYIRQDMKVGDLEASNKKALDVLQRGVTSLGFIVEGRNKLTLSDLEVLLQDICLEAIELNLICCSNKVENAEVLAQFLTNKYGKENTIKASVNIDPVGAMTRNGAYEAEIMSKIKSLVEETAPLKGFSALGVHGKIFRDAGSSIAQELGFALAAGAEYLTQLTEAGLDAKTVAPKIKFNLGVGTNYFMEIAKLRAARFLWAKIVEAYMPGCDSEACACAAIMNIHSENTIWNKTVYDPYVNMLRTQTEAMSAALGGTDSMTVLPFNSIYEESTPFSERIARNQQILLKEESHFDKISDPAAGSYYIETLTDSLASAAWNLFVEVQDKGGYIEAFKSGFIQSVIKETSDKLDKGIAIRRDSLLGTNQFPNFTEYMEKELDAEVFKHHQCKADNAIAEPLTTYRGAQSFEILRSATDAYAMKNKRPLVFMLPVGKLNMRKARAQFAANFFAVAGFAVKEGKGYDTVEAGVADAKKEGADLVVLCSSDEEYATLAPEAFKQLDKEIFVVAGYPECKSDLEKEGIKNFIHVRSNLLEELKAYQEQLIK